MQLIPFKRLISAFIGSILFLDGIYLVSLNKIHLGTLLPVLIGFGLLCFAIFYQKIQVIVQKTPLRTLLWRLSWTGFLIWSMTVLCFFMYLHLATQSHAQIAPVKAIIVLGSGIENGQPSATLAQRLDRAAELAKQQPQTPMIMTGGLDFREQYTEAEIMSKYIQHNYAIASNRIWLEDKSTSTDLNLKNSQAILNQLNIQLNEPIAVVTSDFHTLRAAAIAKKQGYSHIIAVAAPTPLLNRYNSWLREYFAYLSGWLLNEF